MGPFPHIWKSLKIFTFEAPPHSFVKPTISRPLVYYEKEAAFVWERGPQETKNVQTKMLCNI